MTSIGVKLVRAEPWSILADRWDAASAEPDWARTNENTGSLSIAAGAEGQVRVIWDMLAKADGYAVKVQMVAHYDVNVDGSQVTDSAEFMKTIASAQVSAIAQQGANDLVPFMREAIYSMSARLRPDAPILLPGTPDIVGLTASS